MYYIYFYVPATHLEQVKLAMFNAGAGKIDTYSHCAWQTAGEGQYMPLAGSKPFIGKPQQLSKTAEYKVEMVCADEHIHAAIKALKSAHPYEVPAYQVIALENI
jgi:structural hemagglutinin/hemolysin toxin protein RtxA